MDQLLRDGVEKHAEHGVGMWQKVAEFVCQGLGVSSVQTDPTKPPLICNSQCSERYKHHVDPKISSKIVGQWSEQEVDDLRRLVAENTEHSTPTNNLK
eukprot:gene41350-51200_t